MRRMVGDVGEALTGGVEGKPLACLGFPPPKGDVGDLPEEAPIIGRLLQGLDAGTQAADHDILDGQKRVLMGHLGRGQGGDIGGVRGEGSTLWQRFPPTSWSFE